jgi:TRAP-type C4-dicarboxylate transport system substrate-binding protein
MDNRSSRRGFLTSTAAALASVAMIRYPGEAAEFSFKYGHPAPATHPLHLRATEMWAAIKRETNGRVDTAVFPNSVLGGDTALLSQLRSGAIEFLSFTGGTLGSVVPEASMDAIGYAFKTRQEALATLDGPLGEHICRRMETRGIHGFRKIWENGYREITSSTQPVHTAADLAGFKIRTPPAPLWVDLFTALGAAPTPMNFSEVYTARTVRRGRSSRKTSKPSSTGTRKNTHCSNAAT